MTRTLLVDSRAIAFALVILGAITNVASAQTPLPGGYEINLLDGYKHEPLQGIDSIVGKLVKKDGPQIQFEIGRISEGGLRLGGDYVNQAQRVPEADRLWLKEQRTGGRTIHAAYTKDLRLIVSSTGAAEGANFSTIAKTPEDVADVLLMVLTLNEPRKEK